MNKYKKEIVPYNNEQKYLILVPFFMNVKKNRHGVQFFPDH